MIQKTGGAQLERLADAYLDALIARDPSRLCFAANARFTENAQVIPIGTGLWRTAAGPITYRFVFADDGGATVGLFAVLEENGIKVILAARLACIDGAIGELETIVVRRMGALFDPDGLRALRPLFLAPLAPDERASREAMVRAADLYFEGIEQDDGDIIPFSADCHRVENGLRVTGTEELGNETIYTEEMAAKDPAFQISSHFFHYIKKIRDRRYPIVDREHGLVASIVVFDHPADDIEVTLPDGSVITMPPEALTPSSALLYYLFKIRAGQIAGIEVAYLIMPYGLPDPWRAAVAAAAT